MVQIVGGPLVPCPAVLSVFEAIVLGIVQGLTEFLPISSSGHLRIVPAFFGWDDPGAGFTAVIQMGTMAAVLLYFREDLWNITRMWLRSLRDPEVRSETDARLGWYLIIGTLPIIVFGFLLKDPIENEFRSLELIGSTLIVLGLILLAADRLGRKEREVEQITLRDGVAMGFAQSLALIPGVSRSGATITAGLFLGLNRAAAARFSFLLSVPAVVLSGGYELRHFVDGSSTGGAGTFDLIVATVAAFISGYASIAFLLKFLVTHTFDIFVLYRVGLGIAVIGLAAGGAND